MNISDEILNALEKTESATVSDIAGKTGFSKMKVSAAIHHLISAGKAFHIGEVPISKSREVNLYSAKARQAQKLNFEKQSWLSPLMQ
jgi:DNA-binding MarR family transcriptional regulator